ncbi:hypothetical protein R1sor_006665 [Riccia sorocarpa]|uniref:SWIM-type domain-containing protein n=1 Tax=Riccia sorocarpa TaxID=122646 RepID=A0ABD3HRP4_9MARC
MAAADEVALPDMFIEEFASDHSFIQYYRTNWHTRIDRWSRDFGKFKHNNQETNGAIERWHQTLKTHLRAERKWKSGRQISCLLHVLMDEIESLYWCLAQLKKQGRICNRIRQQYALTTIKNARAIPDSSVNFTIIDGTNCAFVQSLSTTGKVHEVIAYHTDLATCTCLDATQGNICKHQIKCHLLQGHTETSLVHRLGTSYESFAGGFGSSASPEGDEHAEPVDIDLNAPVDLVTIDGILEDTPLESETVLYAEAQSIGAEVSAARKIFTLEDARKMVDHMWHIIGGEEDLAAHATVLLTDASEALKKLVATRSSLEHVSSLELFVPLSRNDSTLRRKTDFLERIFSQDRKRPNEPACLSEVQVPDFVRKV